MKVASGIYKGHPLIAPSGLTTRPMAAKVKEALFDILGPFGSEQIVLDLFAGTGSLGIEAISRGAKGAVFVEQNRAALNVLYKNLYNLKLADNKQIQVIEQSVQKTIPKLSMVFDVIFVDAPYYAGILGDVLAQLGQAKQGCLIGPHTVVMAQHPHKSLPNAPIPVSDYGKLQRTSSRTYGQSTLSFYMLRE